MKREDYKNFVWYPVTDDTYWVEDEPEFDNCFTIVKRVDEPMVYTRDNIFLGWGTMAKFGCWLFMIIEHN